MVLAVYLCIRFARLPLFSLLFFSLSLSLSLSLSHTHTHSLSLSFLLFVNPLSFNVSVRDSNGQVTLASSQLPPQHSRLVLMSASQTPYPEDRQGPPYVAGRLALALALGNNPNPSVIRRLNEEETNFWNMYYQQHERSKVDVTSDPARDNVRSEGNEGRGTRRPRRPRAHLTAEQQEERLKELEEQRRQHMLEMVNEELSGDEDWELDDQGDGSSSSSSSSSSDWSNSSSGWARRKGKKKAEKGGKKKRIGRQGSGSGQGDVDTEGEMEGEKETEEDGRRHSGRHRSRKQYSDMLSSDDMDEDEDPSVYDSKREAEEDWVRTETETKRGRGGDRASSARKDRADRREKRGRSRKGRGEETKRKESETDINGVLRYGRKLAEVTRKDMWQRRKHLTPKDFLPSSWISMELFALAPYIPQIGDCVVYVVEVRGYIYIWK